LEEIILSGVGSLLDTFMIKINWFVKNALTSVLILSKDEAKLVFKDIYRLYNEDIIFLKENYRRYNFSECDKQCI
jgi:hypothetical protein